MKTIFENVFCTWINRVIFLQEKLSVQLWWFRQWKWLQLLLGDIKRPLEYVVDWIGFDANNSTSVWGGVICPLQIHQSVKLSIRRQKYLITNAFHFLEGTTNGKVVYWRKSVFKTGISEISLESRIFLYKNCAPDLWNPISKRQTSWNFEAYGEIDALVSLGSFFNWWFVTFSALIQVTEPTTRHCQLNSRSKALWK